MVIYAVAITVQKHATRSQLTSPSKRLEFPFHIYKEYCVFFTIPYETSNEV